MLYGYISKDNIERIFSFLYIFIHVFTMITCMIMVEGQELFQAASLDPTYIIGIYKVEEASLRQLFRHTWIAFLVEISTYFTVHCLKEPFL